MRFTLTVTFPLFVPLLGLTDSQFNDSETVQVKSPVPALEILKLLELVVVPKLSELGETESEGAPSFEALTEILLLPPLLLMLIVPFTVWPALILLRFTLTITLRLFVPLLGLTDSQFNDSETVQVKSPVPVLEMLKLLELLVVPKSIELLETESEGMPSLAARTEILLLPPLLLMLIVPSTVCPALMLLRFTLTVTFPLFVPLLGLTDSQFNDSETVQVKLPVPRIGNAEATRAACRAEID